MRHCFFHFLLFCLSLSPFTLPTLPHPLQTVRHLNVAWINQETAEEESTAERQRKRSGRLVWSEEERKEERGRRNEAVECWGVGGQGRGGGRERERRREEESWHDQFCWGFFVFFFREPDSWTDCLYSNTLLCRTLFFIFFYPLTPDTHKTLTHTFFLLLFKHLSSATIYLSASSSRLLHQLALSLSSDCLPSLQFPSSLNLTCLGNPTRFSFVCFSYLVDPDKNLDFALNASSAAVDVWYKRLRKLTQVWNRNTLTHSQVLYIRSTQLKVQCEPFLGIFWYEMMKSIENPYAC